MTTTVPSGPPTDAGAGEPAVLVGGRALSRLAGRRILVLNWRDVRHSQAGGAEAYAHEISTRWAAAGAQVVWLTARDAGQSARDEIDGVEIRRAGGTMSVYCARPSTSCATAAGSTPSSTARTASRSSRRCSPAGTSR